MGSFEDLSRHHWPPPWAADQVDAVWSVCDAIAASPPPRGLSIEARTALAVEFWRAIAIDPGPIHDLRVVSRSWLEAALPLLQEVEEQAVVTGDALVHADIRSDNVCIGAQVKVIDWNWAFVGNPMLRSQGVVALQWATKELGLREPIAPG